MRAIFALAIFATLHVASRAEADPSLTTTASTALPEGTTRAWPWAIDFHFVAGVEPHSVGTAASFGTGLEVLYAARVGFFADILAANGSKIVVQNVAQPGLPDRISIPFGLAVRPFSFFVKSENHRYWARLLESIGADLGVSVEILRTSDTTQPTAAFHLAGYVDVPLYGGPRTGGVALRIMGRGIFGKSYRFESDGSIGVPSASGQLLFGVTVAL